MGVPTHRGRAGKLGIIVATSTVEQYRSHAVVHEADTTRQTDNQRRIALIVKKPSDSISRSTPTAACGR